MHIQLKPCKIGRRKKLSLFCKEDNSSYERGFNKTVVLYEFDWKNGHLIYIGSNGKLDSAGWKGAHGEGITVLREYYTDLECGEYAITDKRVINYQTILF